MRMKFISIYHYGIAAIVLCLFSGASSAVVPNGIATSQPRHTEKSIQTIAISGLRDQDWRSYKYFLRGIKMFEELHSLAPKTDLNFILRPQVDGVDLGKLTMALENDDFRRPILVNADGIFKLPNDPIAAEKNAEVSINQKRNLFKWNFLAIRTPGLAANERRIGDLRLTCEVYVAMEKWAKIRIEFGLTDEVFSSNVCQHEKIFWTFYEPQIIKSATIVNGTYRRELDLTPDGFGFSVFLGAPLMDNDSVIVLKFE